jgi:hypothetical protein
MRFSALLVSFCLLTACGTVLNQGDQVGCAQDQRAQPGPTTDLPAGQGLLVGFYNVENLFDTLNDPSNPGDDWVLEDPDIGFDEGNYAVKIGNLARAIRSMGSDGPDILGLAEVENACVVADLIQHPELADRGYRLVHEESPDHRGIDVALIYDPTLFAYRAHQSYEVDFDDPNYTGRAILAVRGEVNGQSLHLLVDRKSVV